MNRPLDDAISRIYSPHRGSSANPVAALVVTGDPDAAEFMRFALAQRCALVELVATARQAEQLLSRCRFDVLIVDNSLPAARTWISSWRAQGHNLTIVLLTEQKMPLPSAGIETLIKPFALEQLLAVVDRALSGSSAAEAEITLPPLDDEPPPAHLANIICHSEAMQHILATIQVVASRNTTVLLQGESGSGKEIAAQCLHHFSGRRGAFVPVNCSAISPELVESELFGHTRGAFTGAAQARQGLFSYAEGGTLFLDEIGELPSAMQAKLLRVLEERTIRPVGLEQERPIDVRIIAATNRNMAEEVAQGRFREDLYHRLNVIRLRLPPLRERPSDIPHLVQLFSRQLSRSLDVPPLELDEQELRRLQAYPWPGNVRELRNVIERAMLLGLYPSDCLDSSDLDLALQPATSDYESGYSENFPLAEVERLHSLKVLAAADGNKSEAARRLGISRKTLERKLKVWEGEEEG